uniref:Histone-lysine N-methyltransferase PRDM9 n=1 Tax=Cacopsylla melanoneura TaxID=428564 RepID=A0A8D9AD89_9HEMI
MKSKYAESKYDEFELDENGFPIVIDLDGSSSFLNDIDPELLSNHALADIDPEILSNHDTLADIDPELLSSLALPNIDPELLSNHDTLAALDDIDPELLSCLGPEFNFGDAASNVQITQQVSPGNLNLASQKSVHNAKSSSNLESRAQNSASSVKSAQQKQRNLSESQAQSSAKSNSNPTKRNKRRREPEPQQKASCSYQTGMGEDFEHHKDFYDEEIQRQSREERKRLGFGKYSPKLQLYGAHLSAAVRGMESELRRRGLIALSYLNLEEMQILLKIVNYIESFLGDIDEQEKLKKMDYILMIAEMYQRQGKLDNLVFLPWRQNISIYPEDKNVTIPEDTQDFEVKFHYMPPSPRFDRYLREETPKATSSDLKPETRKVLDILESKDNEASGLFNKQYPPKPNQKLIKQSELAPFLRPAQHKPGSVELKYDTAEELANFVDKLSLDEMKEFEEKYFPDRPPPELIREIYDLRVQAKETQQREKEEAERKDKPEPQQPEGQKQRYPKRNLERVNYAEPEVPNRDDYVYCDECHHVYLGPCLKHPRMYIHDTLISENSANPSYDSCPPMLTIDYSAVPYAGMGVWSTTIIRANTVFGPYVGVRMYALNENTTSAGYTWEIKYDRTENKRNHFIDASDSQHSNWMRYVNCARNAYEENLVAFQYKGRVFYRVTKHIPPMVELLVNYGNEYCKRLFIDIHSYNDENRVWTNAVFQCMECDHSLFSSPLYIEIHARFCPGAKFRSPDPEQNEVEPQKYISMKLGLNQELGGGGGGGGWGGGGGGGEGGGGGGGGQKKKKKKKKGGGGLGKNPPPPPPPPRKGGVMMIRLHSQTIHSLESGM